MKLPPLKSLPVFEAVARLNSFSRAADELALGQSAVSHQIKQLEQYLGESLFVRSGRAVTITEAGRQYLDAVSSALLSIERASNHLVGQETAQIRLSVFSSFAVRWLVPRLPELQRSHPELDLVLEMTGTNPELTERVADCFITIRPDSPAFTYDLLYVERLFPVCSPDYWQKIRRELGRDHLPEAHDDRPLGMEELSRFPLLSTHSIFNRAGGDWESWCREQGQSVPEHTRFQHFSHMLLALEGARYHQGVALTNDYMLSQSRDSGDFVRLPAAAIGTGDSFYFAWKTARRREQGIQLLRRWLIGQAVGSGLRAESGDLS